MTRCVRVCGGSFPNASNHVRRASLNSTMSVAIVTIHRVLTQNAPGLVRDQKSRDSCRHKCCAIRRCLDLPAEGGVLVCA